MTVEDAILIKKIPNIDVPLLHLLYLGPHVQVM